MNRDGNYRVVLADPPWLYRDRKCGSTKFGLGSVGQYGCIPTEALCGIPVDKWTAQDSILLLWTTWPHLLSAREVIEAWGFKYVTLGFIWVKTNKNAGTPFFGPGYYTKANSEPCLLAKRGKGLKPITNTISQVICEELIVSPARVDQHSQKPALVRDRIVELFGDVPRLEMFARQQVPGWDAWGDEINPLDALDVPLL